MSHEFIEITWQRGTVAENGRNGATVEEVIEVAIERLRSLDADLPCYDNHKALTSLQTALAWLHERTLKRQESGVKGTSKPHKEHR